MKRFVYKKIYADLLISMIDRKAQIDELAREHKTNAGHLRNVLDQWTREKVVNKVKSGREYQITLTTKGLAIAKVLAKLIQLDEDSELIVDSSESLKEEKKKLEEAKAQAEAEAKEKKEQQEKAARKVADEYDKNNQGKQQ